MKKNAGASLIDIGDGVGCIEFHSKMNALGGDIVQMITQTLKPGGPGDNFDAFVITNDAANFSVGANIMMLLMAVQEEEWDEVDLAVRQFQGMTQAIKFSPKPVVVAPFGMTLGGGCEDHAARARRGSLTRSCMRPGRGRRRPAARRRRLQGDDTARHRQGHAHPSRRSRRERGNDGGHEAGVRDGGDGEGLDVGVRGEESWIHLEAATTSR